MQLQQSLIISPYMTSRFKQQSSGPVLLAYSNDFLEWLSQEPNATRPQPYGLRLVWRQVQNRTDVARPRTLQNKTTERKVKKKEKKKKAPF